MTLLFTEDHEWVRVEGDTATIGITSFAQTALGDVVFVELPELGSTIEVGKEVAVVESVKAASEVFTPVSGTIIAANQAIVDDPSLVNREPEGEAWFFKVKLTNRAELESLMDEAAYKAFIEEP